MNLERLLKAAGQKVPARQTDTGDQSSPSTGAESEAREQTRRALATGALFCSIRHCSPKAVSSTIRRRFVKRLNELMLALASRGSGQKIWTPDN